MKRHRPHSRGNANERGQTFLIIVVFIAVFLLAVLGIAADYTQVWAHRQMAQAAADAACQAGAADVFLQAEDPNASGNNGIGTFSWIGSDFDCSANGTSPPCKYAALNGYSGSNVHVSFPSSLPGVASIPSGFGTIAHPYIQVKVTDPVGMSFTKLVHAGTVNMTATAGCGLNPVSVPIPLVVLHQTATGSLNRNGGATITILGGPNRAVQVDSSSTTAVMPTSGGSGLIDLTAAGPNGSGADFGVFGQETQPSYVHLGSGNWVTPAAPFGDPWVTFPAPGVPASAGVSRPVPFGTNGCPDPNGCVEFLPGDYSGSGGHSACLTGTITYQFLNSEPDGCVVLPITLRINDRNKNKTYNTLGEVILPTNNNANRSAFKVIQTGTPLNTNNNAFPPAPPWPQAVGGTVTDGTVKWQNIGVYPDNSNLQTAIFDPGRYYLGAHGVTLGAGSTARMSTAAGDGTNGVMFYFTAGTSVSVDSNAGKSPACTAASYDAPTPNGCIVTYKIDGTNSPAATGSVPMRLLKCPGGAKPPDQVPSTIDGNILLGPCSGTYGSSDGTNRGFLFFQSHSNFATPSWGGGGQFLLSGFMYFHSSSTGSTCGTDTTCLNMNGGSGAGAFTLGNIVVDQLNITGNSGIKMILNPAVTFQVLRPTLLQ